MEASTIQLYVIIIGKHASNLDLYLCEAYGKALRTTFGAWSDMHWDWDHSRVSKEAWSLAFK